MESRQEYAQHNLVINEVMVNNRNSIRDEKGDFEGWIEIFNKGYEAANLHGFGLSNDPKQPFLWTFPDITIQPRHFCIVWTSAKNRKESVESLHTNFKLNDKDKVILLTAPDSSQYDIFVLEPMGDNISFGRMPDGGSLLHGFDEGTPGKANSGEILFRGPGMERLKEPFFSHDSGFYMQPFKLILETNYSNALIYYTLDGSDPTKNSEQYTKPILIPSRSNRATVVRAIAYKEGCPRSDIVTKSYFVDEKAFNNFNIPVVSLVTDPMNLFDYEKGIYIAGKIFDEWKNNNPDIQTNQTTPANYNQRGKSWEIKGSVELIEPNGNVGISQNIGIRTQGGFSRASPLKPLALFARKAYDDKEYISYDLFEGDAKNCVDGNKIDKFSHILLRTSSTDSKYALFRDAFVQSLVCEPAVLDIQSSRPCNLFINGEYYGIHNIREAYDKNYISNHYNIEEKDVVIIKNPTGSAGVDIEEGYAGDDMHYNRIITYIREHGLKNNSNYDYIKTQIDTNNFIEYNVLEIYCDNRDWPGNNVSIWRKRVKSYEPNASYGSDGRWRWLVYDLDYGFGLHYGKKAAMNNSLKRATEKNGTEWPNPDWSTFLLRSLLENDEFKIQFINVFADRLNTVFSPEAAAGRIEAMKEIYYPNVMNHILRWNLHHNKIENWLAEIEEMKNFALIRPQYIYQYINEYFGLNGTCTIRVDTTEGGSILVNSLYIEHTDIPWEGIYFKDIPITVQARPEPGFIFKGWEGISNSTESTIKINLSQNTHLRAIYKREKEIDQVVVGDDYYQN